MLIRFGALAVLCCVMGCQPKPLTREQQIGAYRTCVDAGDTPVVVRNYRDDIIDVQCDPHERVITKANK
jgi:hypothetical protein